MMNSGRNHSLGKEKSLCLSYRSSHMVDCLLRLLTS
jgi:hypothetical protein